MKCNRRFTAVAEEGDRIYLTYCPLDVGHFGECMPLTIEEKHRKYIGLVSRSASLRELLVFRDGIRIDRDDDDMAGAVVPLRK
jgi:hypothetical protein